MSHHSEHSYARLLYHFVWSTEERKPFIVPAIEEKLYACIGQICQRRDWYLRAIGGTEDHVHLVVQLPIKHDLPDVVARIKANSSRFIRELELPEFSWQRGYGVFTTDSLPRLQKYISGQKNHHQKQSYNDEYDSLLDGRLII